MPAEQVDAMIANRGSPRTPAARPGRAPLVTLLRELDRRPDLTHVSVAKDGESVEWRRAP
jgi:hypothetical protein